MNTAHLRSRADLILFAGRVITLDGAAHVAEAVVVLSDDPSTCAETSIRDITADVTIVGGRIVHERAQA